MSHSYDLAALSAQLMKLVRLKRTPVGMQFFESLEAAKAVPKVRFPQKRHSVCQVLSQSVQLGRTVGITAAHPHADYCSTINGMFEKDDRFRSGKMFDGAWFEKLSDCAAHHASLDCVPAKYQAIVFSPLSSDRIDPDVVILYGTSGQMFMILAGLLHGHFKKLNFSFSSESACSNSWAHTMVTGEPGLALPSFAERKFGGVADDELILSLTPKQFFKAVTGLKALSSAGLRYPIPTYSCTTDIIEGMPESYLEF